MKEIERQWKLLRLIPTNKHDRRSTYDLWQLLRAQIDCGDISKRTVERYLLILQTIFPLEKKIEGLTQYWYWQCNVNLWLPNLSHNFGNLGEIDELQRLLRPLRHDGRLGKLIERGFVGRQWALDDIETWRVSSTQRVYWLVADPGMGKSAIAARLVHGSDRYTVAYHFCHFNEPETCRPEAFVRSLAFQLAICLPNYRQRLINTAKYAINPLEEMHADDLFTLLLSDPLRHAGDEGQSTNRKLVVVDALDDAPMIADMLVRRHEELPDWIALLLTSRPHTQFGGALKHTLASHDSRNLSDLEAYLEQWLSSLKPPPPAEAHKQLLRRSEGNILYLATAREGVKAGIFRLDDLGSYPAGLGALYKAWFDRYFSNEVDWEGTLSYQLLELVCASPEPLPLSLARRILEWKGRDQIKATLPLGSLIHNDEGVVELFHRSLSDWLQDADHAKTYWVNAEDGRIKLATALWIKLPHELAGQIPTYTHRVLPGLLLSTPQERRREIWGNDKQRFALLEQLDSVLEGFQTHSLQLCRVELARVKVQECQFNYGDTAAQTLNAFDALGNLLIHTALAFHEARAILERVLATREQVLGSEHPDTARSLNNLAGLLRTIGDYATARPLYERAQAINEQVLGPEHPDTADNLNKLAGLLKTLGDYDAARPLYERSLAIREKALGANHPDTASSLNSLASLLKKLGQYDAARPLYKRSLTIRETVLGPDHPSTADTLNSLAGLHKTLGDYDAARQLFERALAIREKVLGLEHHTTATSLNNLAVLLKTLGDYDAARPLLERALAIRQQVLGPQHPDTLETMQNLAGQA